MTPLIIKYPLDLSGEAITNRTEDEQVTLPRTRSRAFAPKNGPFFADSFELFALPAMTKLNPGTDYKLLYLYEEATRKAGQPIVGVVHVTNTEYFGDFSYNYQVIGGTYVSNVEAIMQAIAALQIDNRVVYWDDLLGKPVVFPAAPHLHHVNDLYGMEAVIEVLQDLLQAMLTGDELLKEQILERLQRTELTVNEQGSLITALTQDLAALSDRVGRLERGL